MALPGPRLPGRGPTWHSKTAERGGSASVLKCSHLGPRVVDLVVVAERVEPSTGVFEDARFSWRVQVRRPTGLNSAKPHVQSLSKVCRPC